MKGFSVLNPLFHKDGRPLLNTDFAHYYQRIRSKQKREALLWSLGLVVLYLGAGNLAESPAAATPAAPVAATPEKPKEAPVAAPKAAAEAPRALRDSEAPRQRRQPGERPLASPAVRQRARDLGK